VPGRYALETTPAAARDLRDLARRPPEPGIVKRIDQTILALADDPRPAGSIKLQGSDFRRVAVSD